MNQLSRAKIRKIILREYFLLEQVAGSRDTGESSTDNNAGNSQENAVDAKPIDGAKSFEFKIDTKKITKDLKAFLLRVKKNSVKMVKNPKKFFNSQAGKNFEAILETSGVIILELSKKSGNPALAGTGLTFLVAGMIIDIVQKDMVGLFANVCLLTPGFAELAKSGAYGDKVKNAKGVTNLVNALKAEAQGGNKLLNVAVIAGTGISQQTNTANVSKAIYTDKKIQKMNNVQLKRSANIVKTISKVVGLPEAQQTMTSLTKRINTQINVNKKHDKTISSQEKEKVNEMKITRSQLRKLMLAEALSEQSNTPDTMEDWWSGVEKDITADYKEDVSGSLSSYTGAKTVNIKYVSTGTPDASDNYPADHKFEITPNASESSPQGSFNEMVSEKLDQNSEQAGDDFWVSMANKYGDFNFEYKPAKPDASAGRNLDMDTGNTGVNEVKRIKITKRRLRELVLEAFEPLSDNDQRVTGLNIMLPFYEESHEMWRGGFAGDLDFSDLNFEENAIRQFVEALIAHPDSQLEPQEEEEALGDFEEALKGNNTAFFAPKFDADDVDYDSGPYNYESSPYDSMGNFGPDMSSR